MSILYRSPLLQVKLVIFFGTIHLGKQAYLDLPLEVKRALNQASHCIFELNRVVSERYYKEEMLQWDSRWFKKQKIFSPTDIPKEYLESANEELNALLAQGKITQPQIPGLSASPLRLAHMVFYPIDDMPEQKPTDILDEQLIKYAKSKHKKISYLESIKEQSDMLFGRKFSYLEQIEIYYFMRDSVRKKGREFARLVDFEEAYQKEDSIQMRKCLSPEFMTSQEAPESARRYFKGTSTDRDITMADRMKPYLDEGNAFVAVGGAHLDGIAGKLQTEGYKVEAVSLGSQRYAIDYVIDEKEKVAAFIKIYNALYVAQTSFFKKRGFLPNKDTVVSWGQIEAYAYDFKNARTAKAFALASAHYKKISSSNTELLKEICKEGYSKSSSVFGLFKRTKTNLDDPKQVAKASSKTRTGSVRVVLDC